MSGVEKRDFCEQTDMKTCSRCVVMLKGIPLGTAVSGYRGDLAPACNSCTELGFSVDDKATATEKEGYSHLFHRGQCLILKGYRGYNDEGWKLLREREKAKGETQREEQQTANASVSWRS